MKNTNKPNHRTLKANDRMWYGDTYHYDVQGKEHIIDDVSFTKDYHSFYVQGICGTRFKTRNKDNASYLDTNKSVTCFKCMIKAGFVKYHSPLNLKFGSMTKPKQIGKKYTVLISFDDYKVNDIYEYTYKTV